MLTKEEFEHKIKLIIVVSETKIDNNVKIHTINYADFFGSLILAIRWIIGIILIVGSTIIGPMEQGLHNFDEISVFQLVLGILLLPITTDKIKKLLAKR